MLRSEFIKKVAERTEETQTIVKTILEGIEEETEYLVSVEDFVPFKFGRIGGKTKPARKARNPKTGESVNVPEKKGIIYLKPTSKMKK